MQLLSLTVRDGGGIELLPSLDYLGHDVSDLALDAMSLPLMAAFDVVIVDATQNPRAAAAACQRVAVQERSAPIIVVVSESSLAALNPTWGFDDWILPTASPAELETRLQLVGRLGGRAGGRPGSSRSATW